jgi:hypothetical protein
MIVVAARLWIVKHALDQTVSHAALHHLLHLVHLLQPFQLLLQPFQLLLLENAPVSTAILAWEKIVRDVAICHLLLLQQFQAQLYPHHPHHPLPLVKQWIAEPVLDQLATIVAHHPHAVQLIVLPALDLNANHVVQLHVKQYQSIVKLVSDQTAETVAIILKPALII